jgi:signal transduction histidine kinase
MPGMLMRLRTILTDPQTWRDIIWLLVNAVLGFTLCLLSAVLFLATLFYLVYPLLVGVTPEGVFTEPFGGLLTVNFWTSFLLMPVALIAFLIWQAAGERLLKANAFLARSLLGPTESAKLAMRVRELAESRAETVDTQAAELRRIERDLHDGAQARLAALSMNLGMAEEMVARDPAQAAALLTEARESASTALSELRDLVRGIHPPVLADRGLDGAVRALAMSCPFKVDVTYDVPGRPPAPVESAAYFAVAECLANAVKYSAATTAWIQITHEDEKLHMIVGDDGVGGAVVRPGGGLYGIERRLAAFDGTLTVVSPSAGPTTVIMELPCESSSLKTTPSSGTA